GQPPWNDPAGQQGRRGGGAPAPRPGQGSTPGGGYEQSPGPAQGRGQGYGQRDARSQNQRPGGNPPQYPRTGPEQVPGSGTGPRPAQRGTGPARQVPRGYERGGTGPRRMAGEYQGDYPAEGYSARGEGRFGREERESWDSDAGDGTFLPGFDRRRGLSGASRDGYRGGRGERRDPRDRRDWNDRGDSDDYDDTDWPKRKRSPIRRLAPWIALLVILTPLVIGGLYVYHLYENKYHPADYSGPGTGPAVVVEVNSGDTAFTLGPRLQQLGVVASARAFELAAERSTSTVGLEVGFYRLNHHMQASLAYAALLNPKDRVQLTVLIPEGKRASQVIVLLAKATGIPLAKFQQVIDHPAQLGLPSYAKGKVEGYLFPATYTIQPNETALQILQAMVQRYDVEAQQISLPAAAAKVHLTPEQVIIEASMVQAEGGVISDYPKIARVIINRLNDGMKLQFDSVLLYGLNAYAVNVTDAQIATPGPYNDFQHYGLPPTPICNPGNAAIQGILHPAAGDWLYFLTVTGKASEFSATPLQGQ
ncbi:endolytic transglycosylase MltG, partial [Trebonia sp.]|uniref:endolytic transglycosylase MltG n=1 Tax=Trebonia sp. TaxID=2767075 RepID=UPI00260C3EF3